MAKKVTKKAAVRVTPNYTGPSTVKVPVTTEAELSVFQINGRSVHAGDSGVTHSVVFARLPDGGFGVACHRNYGYSKSPPSPQAASSILSEQKLSRIPDSVIASLIEFLDPPAPVA